MSYCHLRLSQYHSEKAGVDASGKAGWLAIGLTAFSQAYRQPIGSL
jgi:hypothetical protein